VAVAEDVIGASSVREGVLIPDAIGIECVPTLIGQLGVDGDAGERLVGRHGVRWWAVYCSDDEIMQGKWGNRKPYRQISHLDIPGLLTKHATIATG